MRTKVRGRPPMYWKINDLAIEVRELKKRVENIERGANIGQPKVNAAEQTKS